MTRKELSEAVGEINELRGYVGIGRDEFSDCTISESDVEEYCENIIEAVKEHNKTVDE